jgi:hypothetical protein
MTAAAYGSRISARGARFSGTTKPIFRFRSQTANTRPHSRGKILPELCSKLGPPEARGRREDRVRAAPTVSCANMCKETAHEHTGSAEAIRPSLRNGLTAYNVLSPENRALLSPSPADNSASLTPTTEASGPHDFAVRDLQRSPAAAIASTASHRTFVTIASRPSHRVRRGKLIKLICPTC